VLRALIAGAVLGEPAEESERLGAIRLHPHQRTAVARIRAALRRFGGALLADSVGLGKTYVALAVARQYARPVVVAPAVLRPTWLDAATQANVAITFASTESFSRGSPPGPGDLCIVDEAHHFRTTGTRRYARLADLTAAAPVLLLSATPVHNRSEDLNALLALFLGPDARRLGSDALAACVIRREHDDVLALRLPSVHRRRRIEIPAEPAILERILALPPSAAPRDGTPASVLVSAGLAHMWASSDAALLSGIRRRLVLGSALRDVLTAGLVPSRREIVAWVGGEGTAQLGFVNLLVEPVLPSATPDIEALDGHLLALRELARDVAQSPVREEARVAAVRRLRSAHTGEKIVAFSCFSATIHALLRALAADAGVAAITARGGRIATGRIGTEDVLRMFRFAAHPRERISLLLATDMLSEGLSLPEATVVVHLDVPWTAARMEQRVGRLRRPRTTGPAITPYAFVPPPAVELVLRKELRLAGKAAIARQLIGPLSLYDDHAEASSPARLAESIRNLVSSWGNPDAPGLADAGLDDAGLDDAGLADAGLDDAGLDDAGLAAGARCIRVAAVRASAGGFVALVRVCGELTIAAGGTVCGGTDLATLRPRSVLAALSHVTTDPASVTQAAYRAARRSLRRLLDDGRLDLLTRSNAHAPVELKRLIGRLDAAVLRAPLHLRARTAARVSRVRSLLAERLTAGTERRLRDIERDTTDEDLLSACETVLDRQGREAHAADFGVEAVLLLVPARDA
jgi:superfamily II DNA or RNA helicase